MTDTLVMNKKPCLIWKTPALAKLDIGDLSSIWKSPRVLGAYGHSEDVELKSRI